MLELMISKGQESIAYIQCWSVASAFKLASVYGTMSDEVGTIDTYDKFRGRLRYNPCLTVRSGKFDITVLSEIKSRK